MRGVHTGLPPSDGFTLAGLDQMNGVTPLAGGSSSSPARSPRSPLPSSVPRAPFAGQSQTGPLGPLAAITVGKTNSLAASTQLLEAFTTGEEFLPILQNNDPRSSVIPQPQRRSNGVKVPVDRSRLPGPELVHALVQQFAYHHNAAYPIFHIPSLRTLVEQVCFDPSGMSSPTDICIVFRKS